MKHVYLAQLKCPSNHCVLAAVGEYEDDEAAKALGTSLESALAQAVQEKLLRASCALCGAHLLGLSVGRTPYRTLEEAEPVLKELQRRQRNAAELLMRRN